MGIPWLSILIPIYNVKDYLAECIDSVLNQADSGIEVILLDDCSTDGSQDEIQRLAQRWAGRLTVLRHVENAGLSAARNTMIDHAQGAYLWFLDSDDKLLPGAVEELHAVVSKYEPDVILCDFQVWREKMKFKHRLRGESCKRTFHGAANILLNDPAYLLTGMLHTGQLHAWSKISRRSLWGNDLRFPVGQYFEDMRTMLLMASRASSSFYVPHPWVAYRQRTGSILETMNRKKAQDQSAALSTLYQQIQSQKWATNQSLRFALAHQCARNFIGAMRYLSRQAGSGDSTETMRSLASVFRTDFEATSPLTACNLKKAYLFRGWWIRWFKFRRWSRYLTNEIS